MVKWRRSHQLLIFVAVKARDNSDRAFISNGKCTSLKLSQVSLHVSLCRPCSHATCLFAFSCCWWEQSVPNFTSQVRSFAPTVLKDKEKDRANPLILGGNILAWGNTRALLIQLYKRHVAGVWAWCFVCWFSCFLRQSPGNEVPCPKRTQAGENKKKISYKDLIVLSKVIHFNFFNVCCSFEPHFLSRNLSVEVQCRTSMAFFFWYL